MTRQAKAKVRKMKSKKGMELPINFIIMTILAIVVLVFGIYLVTRIFDFSNTTADRLSEQQKEALQRMLTAGEKVAILEYKMPAQPNGHATFALGILNVDAAREYFCINLTPTSAADPQGNEIPSPRNKIAQQRKPALYTTRWRIISSEQQYIDLRVNVPGGTLPGTYSFDVNVCIKNTNPTLAECSTYCPDSSNPLGLDQYGYPTQIYVVVS